MPNLQRIGLVSGADSHATAVCDAASSGREADRAQRLGVSVGRRVDQQGALLPQPSPLLAAYHPHVWSEICQMPAYRCQGVAIPNRFWRSPDLAVVDAPTSIP